MDVKSISEIKFAHFLELPSDLIKLFMIKYFDCISALRCLWVCKRLKNSVSDRDVEIIRFNVIKRIAYDNQVQSGATSRPWQCNLCGTELSGKNARKHAAKHAKRSNGGKSIVRVKENYIVPEPCSICEAPYPQKGTHQKQGCPLEIVNCENYQHVEHNRWVELLCSGFKGYRKAMQQHVCFFRCKYCKKLFNLDVSIINKNGFHRHLETCERKMEIISLWGISLNNK